MKILIVGSDLNAILIAEYLKLQNNNFDIYITENDKSDNNSYTVINIPENDVYSLCDFVKYNQIEYTIVTSSLAIINNIADEFKKNEFPIFAPYAESARITFFNSISKKIMYKLKINTPKFGIFDRENLALDYIRNSKFPIEIDNDFTLFEKNTNYYDTFSKAQKGLQKIFETDIEKIVINNYIDEEPLYLYFITDGFNALPLIATKCEKSDNITTIESPTQKVSENLIIKILQNVIYPLLDDISKYSGGYTGILGLKLKIKKDNYYILNFYNGFQEYDLHSFLSVLDDNLFNILYCATNGCIADNKEYINLLDKYSYTAVIPKNKFKISKEDIENDFIWCQDEKNIIMTSVGSTYNYAKNNMLEYLETVCNDDILPEIKNLKYTEEIKI